MDPADDGLRAAVERACGCRARPCGSVAVRERLHRYALWHGVVHAFALDGHPVASLCFAWHSPAQGTGAGCVQVVLAVPPVGSASEAVRAAASGRELARPPWIAGVASDPEAEPRGRPR